MTTLMSQRGFTLIEIIVVIGLIALIAGFGVAMSYSSIARVGVIEERDLLVSLLLSGARASALANIHTASHGVHIESDKYVLFEGNAWSGSTNHRDVARNSAITVAGSHGDDIIFEQRSGDVLAGVDTTTGIGSITLTGNGKTISFDLNREGRIDW